jgi:hypothetical protein
MSTPNPVFIKVVDNRGRTLTRFIGRRQAAGEYVWYGGAKPHTPRARRRRSKLSDAELARDAKHWRAHSDNPIRAVNGHTMLVLPGLTLRWVKAQRALDALTQAAMTVPADGDTLVFTCNQLRIAASL